MLSNVSKESKVNFKEIRGEKLDTKKVINDVLVHLFNEIWKLEENAIIIDEFKEISNNDMHIIEAIGDTKVKTMTNVAKRVNITVGSLTTAMNALVKKGYVERMRSEEDRRVVYVELTDKGVKAYEHHAAFHIEMTDAVLKALQKEELEILAKTLNTLTDFFHSYEV